MENNTYKDRDDGSSKRSSFGKVEAQPERSSETKRGAKKQDKKKQNTTGDELQRCADKSDRDDNALANAGLAQSDVSDLSCKLNSAKNGITGCLPIRKIRKNIINARRACGEVISSILE